MKKNSVKKQKFVVKKLDPTICQDTRAETTDMNERLSKYALHEKSRFQPAVTHSVRFNKIFVLEPLNCPKEKKSGFI